MKYITVLTALIFATPAAATERFPLLTPQQMTPAQSKVANEIIKSRKNFSGPFSPWLRSPVLADKLQSVGEYVRYNTGLPPALSEFVILITARDWTCQLEWQIHYPIAIAAGVKREILDQLAVNKRPDGMSPDQTLIYDFSIAMHRDKGRVSDTIFDAVRKRFGDKTLVDLIGINAYYDAAAMTINAGQVPLPSGVTPPLK